VWLHQSIVRGFSQTVSVLHGELGGWVQLAIELGLRDETIIVAKSGVTAKKPGLLLLASGQQGYRGRLSEMIPEPDEFRRAGRLRPNCLVLFPSLERKKTRRQLRDKPERFREPSLHAELEERVGRGADIGTETALEVKIGGEALGVALCHPSRLLRLGRERHQNKVGIENDCEPDPPHAAPL